MFNKIIGIFLSILVICSYETCSGCTSRDVGHISSRNALSSALHSATLASLNASEVINIADKCIEACNAEISKRGIEARKEGVSQIQGQATFLKNFLLALQEVQDLVSEENKLSEKSRAIIKKADDLYRGEVGHLCLGANARLKQLNQEIAGIGQ